jgi:outer membrane protein TolC
MGSPLQDFTDDDDRDEDLMRMIPFHARPSMAGAFLLLTMGFTAAMASPLTWDQCLKEAAAHNPALRTSAASLQQARYGKGSAKGKFLPQLNAGASHGRSGDEGSLGAILRDADPQDRTGVNLSLSQNLFNGFKDKASYDRASAQVESARAQFEDARAQVSRDLRAAFYGLLYAQQQVPMLEKIAARRRENVRMVELRYKSGRENKGSFLQSQASSAQADYEVAQAKRSLRLAQRQLARVLGRSEVDAVVVAGEFTVRSPGETPDFRRMATGIPSTRIAAMRLKSAQAQVTTARGAFLPSLNASGSMSRSGSEWMPDDPSWSAGLNLSLPLFSGGQDYFDLKSARSASEQARIGMTTAEQDAALRLEDAFSAWQDAVESTAVQERALEAARVREQIASAQYANGLLSYQDWDQLESALITSEKSRLQGLRAAQVAEADWERAQGKGELP